MCGGKVAIPPIVKEKRRNSERRKEKSRDAARCRRSKESEIFSSLASHLPLPEPASSALDKASVMRLTIACLRLREVAAALAPKDAVQPSPLDECFGKALDGFLLVLSDEGDVLFISEKAEDVLGVHFADMLGHPVFDYLHPCDHEEVRSLLASPSSLEDVSIFLRIRSSLKQPKGRTTMHLKFNAYQVMHCVGHLFRSPPAEKRPFYLLLVATPLPHPAHVEVPLSDLGVFVSRHSPDMRFTHCEERIVDFVGFRSCDLLGQSVFSFHHALDTGPLQQAFRTLLSKGQVETGHYRFLSRHGGHVWLVTQATLLCDSTTQRPECVVCLNYVLSKVEHEGEIVSEQQQKKIEQVDDLSVTCAIFARKDTVMSRQFLNFPDADILLFHEPLKADSKLQLDLFPDDGIEDPFSYRGEDSLSSPSGTPESSLHLPLSAGTSPDRFHADTPDSGSLSDIPSFDPIDTFSNLRCSMTPADGEDCYEEDLDFRAPFIPMQMDDDFPLLSPSNSVMWGPPQETTPRKTPHDTRPSSEPPPKVSGETSLQSSLAALLQSDTKKTTAATNNSNNNSRHNDRNNRRWNGTDNRRQRNFTPSRNSNSSGHIIMLDSVPPVRKQSQARQTPVGHRRLQNSPSVGSHTSTVRVNDRLIKVQVSVSELPGGPIEQKQPFPSPPDPPPKRAPAPSTESPKRIKVDNGGALFTRQGSSDSVLLNLLISGEDASRGYLCSSGGTRHAAQNTQPAVLSLPAHDRQEDNDFLDSYLRLQCDASLLHSDELLDALDHPLLRNSGVALG